MSEKISKGSPFIYSEPVIPPFFAGRGKEMKFITKSLFNEKENLVIYGNDAIGKSSIISTIYTNQILQENSQIFPVRINAFDFTTSVNTNFLGVTTHQICASVWTRLMKHKFSDLLDDSLFNTKNGVFKGSDERAIKKIFKIVSSEKISDTNSYNADLGGKFIIEGKISQGFEQVNQRKTLAPFEFLYLLDELNDIIASYGYNSIMVLCDELNHLPEKTNTDILRNYFSIFQSKKIQFFFVLVNPENIHKEDARNLIDSFNCRIEIETFHSIEDVIELIENTTSNSHSKIFFKGEAVEYLFEKTNGHPWWIQKICDSAFNNSLKIKSDEIDLAIIETSFNEFAEEIKIYNERISLGLPFRKSNLNK